MKRKSRYAVKKILQDTPGWNIIDIACGRTAAWPEANTLMDVKNYTNSYPKRKFITGNVDNGLPFKDQEFDFVIASHILEHAKDPVQFCNELKRISKRGYIEVSTPLSDNLVSGGDTDPMGHKWWITFNDHEQKIEVRKRQDVVHRTVEIKELNMLYPFFRDSLVTEIYWENSTINVEIKNDFYFYEDKEYDLSIQRVAPWVLGTSVLSRIRK